MRSRKVIPVATFVTLSSLLLLPGCATMGSFFGKPRRIAAAPKQTPVEAQPEEIEATDADLGAVEAFLQRTEDYQLPETPAEQTEIAAINPSAAIGSHIASIAPDQRRQTLYPPPLATNDQALANMHLDLSNPVTEKPVLAIPVVQSVSIRTVAHQEKQSESLQQFKATNAPLGVDPLPMGNDVQKLITALETSSKESGSTDGEWRLRLAHLAFQNEDKATQVSSSLSVFGRKILTGLIELAIAAKRAMQDVPDGVARALEQTQDLQWALADRSDPVVAEVALCRKVNAFGVYEEMATEEFLAGRTTQTIVYCEVKWLGSQTTEDGHFRTVLATRIELLSAAGKSVWQHEEPEIVDRCRRRRTDFFLAQRIAIPPTLPAGDYVMKVLVEDKLSGRASEAVHPFTIYAPTSLSYRGG